ncbi:MAG: site-specific integrase [Gammaproteobacteria bacterium]
MAKPTRKSDKDGLYQQPKSRYWYASYTDGSGIRTRRSTGTTDRREAEALLAKWRLQVHRERHWDEEPDHTFDELMLAYLRETQEIKRSADRDRYSLKRLYPVFTGRTLASLSIQDVRAYISARRQEGVGASTINREIGVLSAALNYARREWGWAAPNPVSGHKLRVPEGRVRWLSRAEAVALIQAATREPKAPHLVDFIRLALHTGMRKGELLGLEWRRVDLQADLIHLESQHTKAGKRRSIPLNREARAALLRRAEFQAQHCPTSAWVFCQADGRRIQFIKRSFMTACRRVGIEDFHIHDLRHTCAAWLVSAGVPLPEVRDLLGHSSVQMTERYAHLAPENVRAAVARLEDGKSYFGHTDNADEQPKEVMQALTL